MKQVKMTFPNYPVFAYFMNMFNVYNPPTYTLWIEGPTRESIPVTLNFHTVEDADYEALKKLWATAGGTTFSVEDLPVFIEPQQPHLDFQ